METETAHGEKVSLPMPAGARVTPLQSSCLKHRQSPECVFINWCGEFSGRNNSHKSCCIGCKLIYFCRAAI